MRKHERDTHDKSDQPVWIDAEQINSVTLRSRFDEYHQVPFALRGHIPAIFYGQSVIIGVEQIRTASSSGWTIEELSPRQNPFPWARFADSLLFGICLMILAGMWDSSWLPARHTGIYVLSGIFLISGIDKVLHPAAFVATVERMSLFPDFLVRFSWVMGLIETTTGAAILLRSLRILAIKAIILLMGIFTLVTVGLILKNYRGDCGCMPWAGWTGWASVAKQGVILAVSAALLRGTASHSLDKPLVPVQTGDIT